MKVTHTFTVQVEIEDSQSGLQIGNIFQALDAFSARFVTSEFDGEVADLLPSAEEVKTWMKAQVHDYFDGAEVAYTQLAEAALAHFIHEDLSSQVHFAVMEPHVDYFYDAAVDVGDICFQ